MNPIKRLCLWRQLRKLNRRKITITSYDRGEK